MAINIFPILNYLALFILYVICLYFIFQDYSEIVGFYILFMIHTASTAFIGKDLFNFFLNSPNLATTIAIGSILIGNILHFVCFILILLMISSLQIKFDSTRGTPIRLPDKYRSYLNDFKNQVLVVFILSILVLFGIYYGENILVPLKPLLNTFNLDLWIKSTPTLLIVALSICIVSISSNQVNTANNLARLRNRQLL
jgi:hypothetical protein